MRKGLIVIGVFFCVSVFGIVSAHADMIGNAASDGFMSTINASGSVIVQQLQAAVSSDTTATPIPGALLLLGPALLGLIGFRKRIFK
jgi:hypothetical protein